MYWLRHLGLLAITSLFIAGSIVLAAWIVGLKEVLRTLTNPQPAWITLLFGAQLLAYVGYAVAYKSLYEMRLKKAALRTLYGFSPLAVRGGFAYDVVITADDTARYRAAALSIAEYLILAPAVLGAALYALVSELGVPRGFSLPWAIGVPAGALLATIIVFLHQRVNYRAAGIVRKLILHFKRLDFKGWALVLGGMSVYWTCEIATMFGAIKLFGATISLPALIIAFGTGYVLTRRSLPASFAGLMIILMILVLHLLDVPFGAAFWATYSYLLVSLLLPLGYMVITKFRKSLAED